MKRKILYAIFFAVLLICLKDNVLAVEVSLDDGDYQLQCIYNGLEVTIAKTGVYVINSSLEDTPNSENVKNVSFYLNDIRAPIYDSDGKIKKTFYGSILSDNGGCPDRLYLIKRKEIIGDLETDKYYVTHITRNYGEKMVQGLTYSDWLAMGDFDVSVDSTWVPYLQQCTQYYLDTRIHVDQLQASDTCRHVDSWYYENILFGTLLKEDDYIENNAIALKSENVYLTTSKKTLVCDYTSDGDSSGVSIYKYDNMSFINMDETTTILDSKDGSLGKSFDCSTSIVGNSQSDILINSPFSKKVGNNVDKTYNAVRFYAFSKGYVNGQETAESVCKKTNNQEACILYKYVGSRYGSVTPEENDVCDVLGNRTVNVVLRILSWLQILVPIIVIVLTAIDITKMVLAGNIEEELPKKRKLIVIRIIVMIFFFFIPLVSRLISVAIYGEDLTECLYSETNKKGNNSTSGGVGANNTPTQPATTNNAN